MTKCPVCRKAVKGVSFRCVTCPGAPWVHPRCGGYSVAKVRDTVAKQQNLLRCKNCKEESAHDEGKTQDKENTQYRNDTAVYLESQCTEDQKYVHNQENPEDQMNVAENQENTEDLVKTVQENTHDQDNMYL